MTIRLNKKKLYELFYQEVCSQSKKVDPAEEQDWYSLTLGWMIAKGYTPLQAHSFALYARYDRHYEG